MNDMMRTIAPKSDQLNADDLVGGHTITITINRTEIKESGEQKVIIGYEGDNGKPYKPGKAMCHVLINIWGKSSKEYIGKSMTLYRDEKVKFGPDITGGIRISHMSHIKESRTVIIPVSRGIRKPFTVKPLEETPQEKATPLDNKTLEMIKTNLIEAAKHGTDALQTTWTKLDPKFQKALESFKEECKEIAKKSAAP